MLKNSKKKMGMGYQMASIMYGTDLYRNIFLNVVRTLKRSLQINMFHEMLNKLTPILF